MDDAGGRRGLERVQERKREQEVPRVVHLPRRRAETAACEGRRRRGRGYCRGEAGRMMRRRLVWNIGVELRLF